jgi:hypothetical protein
MDARPRQLKLFRQRASYAEYRNGALLVVIGNFRDDGGVDASFVPRKDIYSKIMASSGTLPVRSPMPNSEQLTPAAPYSQAWRRWHPFVEVIVAVPFSHSAGTSA